MTGMITPDLYDDDHNGDTLLRHFRSQLELFVDMHSSMHRPMALVSSGGTVIDLEINTVRCIDNFSTGKRGSTSVECLLRCGYAVIHLWRMGSTSPYVRLLTEQINNHNISTSKTATPTTTTTNKKKKNRNSNQASSTTSSSSLAATLTVESLGHLFDLGDDDDGDEYDDDDDLVDQEDMDDDDDDPWMTTTTTTKVAGKSSSRRLRTLSLHHNISTCKRLRHALFYERRQYVMREKRLLTIPFRTVEEYISRLQLSATVLKERRSLAMFLLAAAVSDYYIPKHEKSIHKIQSRSSTTTGSNSSMLKKKTEHQKDAEKQVDDLSTANDKQDKKDHDDDDDSSGDLVLRLRPVPKMLGELRRVWAPDAFVVSFKLETDQTLLRSKAEAAVSKYGCHMVIGNLLHSRHDQVCILTPDNFKVKNPTNADGWSMAEVAKPENSSNSDPDALESNIMDFVIQSHFEYISCHLYSSSDNDNDNKKGDDNDDDDESLDELNDDDNTIQRRREERRVERAFRCAHEHRLQKQHEREMDEIYRRRWKRMKMYAIDVLGTTVAMIVSYAINNAIHRTFFLTTTTTTASSGSGSAGTRGRSSSSSR